MGSPGRGSSAYLGRHSSSLYYPRRTVPVNKTITSSSAPSSSLHRYSREPDPAASSSYGHRSSSSRDKYYESSAPRQYDDYKSSNSASKYSSYGTSSSSRSKSSSFYCSSTPTPLMKLSVDASDKDYFGSRYRKAPPEHQRESGYGSSYNVSSSRDRRPSGSAAYSRKHVSIRSSPNTGRGHGVASKSTVIKKTSRPTALSVTSRIRKRAVNSQRSARDKMRKCDSDSRTAVYDQQKEARSKPSKRMAEKRKESADRNSFSKSYRAYKDAGPSKEETHELGLAAENKGRKASHTDLQTTETAVEPKNDSKDVKAELEEKAGKLVVENVKEDFETESVNFLSNSTHTGSYHRDHAKNADKEEVSKQNKKLGDDCKDVGHEKALLKLKCHFCHTSSISYRDYTSHTRSHEHHKVVAQAISEMKRKVNSMRSEQREQQRKLEKSSTDKTLSDTTSFCRVCDLNFRTDPAEHEATSLHCAIKSLIYQKCEVCDIEFRIWKAYLHHLAALEHSKKFALLELQKREGRGELVHGTNLSEKELGLHLVEEKQVLYCNVCSCYISMNGSAHDARIPHCVTFSHVKNVDDYYASLERQQKQQKRKLENSGGKNSASKDESGLTVLPVGSNEQVEDSIPQKLRIVTDAASFATNSINSSKLNSESMLEGSKSITPCDCDNTTKPEDYDDDDEIVLHADDDEDADEEEHETRNAWGRHARSTTKKEPSSCATNDENN